MESGGARARVWALMWAELQERTRLECISGEANKCRGTKRRAIDAETQDVAETKSSMMLFGAVCSHVVWGVGGWEGREGALQVCLEIADMSPCTLRSARRVLATHSLKYPQPRHTYADTINHQPSRCWALSHSTARIGICVLSRAYLFMSVVLACFL